MHSYQEQLRRHLVAYKCDRLGITQSGTFRYRGREITRAHILPRELRWLNVLESIRAEVRAYIAANHQLRLHRYFHHLNSSQAFALNLFYPFLAADACDSEALLKAVAWSGVASTWRFEEVPYEEEETNVDVTWVNPDGFPTYCEVKLSEADYGTARPDLRHRKKLTRTYTHALTGYVGASLLKPEAFFANYQILRNLWLAAKNPAVRVVFLLPRANVRLWKPLRRVLGQVAESLAKRVSVTAIEDVVESLVSSPVVSSQLRWHARKLREKYVPPLVDA